jgi:hypothetical protein
MFPPTEHLPIVANPRGGLLFAKRFSGFGFS